MKPQATIYVTREAWTTSQAIKDLDYYDRCTLSDIEATDLTGKEGYYLKNANIMHIAPLPDNAHIALRLLPGESAIYSTHVCLPTNLRGCIFEKAPNIPERYAEIVRFWSGDTLNSNVGNAAYYQNITNRYEVDLSALHANPDLFSQRRSTPEIDALLSEGIVVCITGLADLLTDAPHDAFAEIAIPVDDAMLGLDNGGFMTQKGYDLRPKERVERIFLLVSDVRNSPDPNRIYIDALRYEELDYGFYY
ncbi:hypothetical protein [Noviherbaspirillum denitrificans]|uniref:Uncharacterized protein n=1 Tax=Noviherbaspirillum denitrificans TaxID=1968433 RepID=A0A254T6V3_9BURK|nr:hypothetical protein [Noviherbaspirillum denitrificans]OWW18366.1 hypothetical protein AYR66_01220 [Noviherbaspirillum denitrificans]